MSHALRNYERFMKLQAFLNTRHPEINDCSAIFIAAMVNFDPIANLALAKEYVGFIHRYRDALQRIPFTQQEWNLIEEILVDLELELVLACCESDALVSRSRNHL